MTEIRLLISIIIPTFNRANLICETLDSVLKQTYQNWECIIVDDGSTDNTGNLLEEYVKNDWRFKFLTRPNHKKKGPSGSRNFGLEQACGNYIIFLDSDDLLSKDCLKNRISFALDNPNKELWIFRANTFANRINDFDRLVNLLPTSILNEETFYLSSFYQGNFPFVVMCPLWKKEALLKLGGFDEKLLMLEDPELHLRAFKAGFKSKTAYDLPVDCFYRKGSGVDTVIKREKYNSIKPDSNYYFLQKHLNKNVNDSVNRFKMVYNSHVFNDKSFSFNAKMIRLGKEKQVVTISHVILSYSILLMSYLGLHKVKGTGYYKLRNHFNKVKI